MERLDDFLLTYFCHPPCHLSDGSRLDRSRTFDERQEYRTGPNGIRILVVSPILIGGIIAHE